MDKQKEIQNLIDQIETKIKSKEEVPWKLIEEWGEKILEALKINNDDRV